MPTNNSSWTPLSWASVGRLCYEAMHNELNARLCLVDTVCVYGKQQPSENYSNKNVLLRQNARGIPPASCPVRGVYPVLVLPGRGYPYPGPGWGKGGTHVLVLARGRGGVPLYWGGGRWYSCPGPGLGGRERGGTLVLWPDWGTPSPRENLSPETRGAPTLGKHLGPETGVPFPLGSETKDQYPPPPWWTDKLKTLPSRRTSYAGGNKWQQAFSIHPDCTGKWYDCVKVQW